ncbi:ribonuclease E [Alcanivorax sp. JB21]|uniref:ribonuclease E n=1 Tax=Alcanivorax limicola TaxID=2874102 RepID=UPI001CBF12E3|nr:ribonuclease E [Alcanivorax limicola]MBZ2187709.1 ribonuclease E [Alcanivorax limicola]
MKRMLINATHPEEVRVALVDGQRLYDLDIEHRTREQKKANIYKGKITRVEPSLEAAFVDFGAERHGFLPLKEISRQYFSKDPKDIQGRINIKEVVREGQEVIVQVDKEERGNKGAALSTFISLAGRYLVLMPNNPRAGGISRRIEGEERQELKEALGALKLPADMGVIVRTAGLGRSPEELQWDLDYLLKLWDSIDTAGKSRPAPFLVYQESNVIIRAIRDYLRKDIGEVLIDSDETFAEANGFVTQVMNDFANKIKLYKDETPLFSRYQIESQIETAFQREVKLPSGGSIVIDPTEALVSIDINSSRATKGADIEETALQTNLEAADEISRQLRLRDIGGLIVVDFIDMGPARNQREVENRMREALEADRARVQVGRISRFGLMELSRQRLRPSLGETSSIVCPRCNGQGHIRDVKSLALSILRLVEEEVMKERTGEIQAQVPVPVATYLLNEKRQALRDIEGRYKIRVLIIPNQNLETPHFEVQRIRDDQVHATLVSHEVDLLEGEEDPSLVSAQDTEIKRQEAAVKLVAPDTAAPPPKPRPEPEAAPAAAAAPGMLARLVAFIVQLFKSDEPRGVKAERKPPQRKDNQGNRRGTEARGGQGRSRRGGEGRQSEGGGRGRRNDTRGSRDSRGENRGEKDDTRGDNPRGRGGRNNDNRNAEGRKDGGRQERPERQQQDRQQDRSQQEKGPQQKAPQPAADKPQRAERNDADGNRQDAAQDGAQPEQPRSGRSRRRRSRGGSGGGGGNAQQSGQQGDQQGAQNDNAQENRQPRQSRQQGSERNDDSDTPSDNNDIRSQDGAERRSQVKDDRPLRQRQRPAREGQDTAANAETAAATATDAAANTAADTTKQPEAKAPTQDKAVDTAGNTPAAQPAATPTAPAAQQQDAQPASSPKPSSAEQKPAEQPKAEATSSKPAANGNRDDRNTDNAAARDVDGNKATPAQGTPSQPRNKPVAEKPVAPQPAADKPAAEKAVTEKPAAEKPAATPATPAPATEKPVADKPVAEKPAAAAPEATPAAPAAPQAPAPAPAPAPQQSAEKPAEPAASTPKAPAPAAQQPTARASNDPRVLRRQQEAERLAAAKQAEDNKSD